jgi:hypothetical protein
MSGGGYGVVPSGGVPGGGALSGGAPTPVPWSRIRDGAYWLQEVVKRSEPALRPDVGHIVLARTAGILVYVLVLISSSWRQENI